MSVQVERRHFTVAEYYRMAEAGILSEDDRVELIEGEIITMSPIGSRHAAGVDRLTALFHRSIGQSAIIRIQSPVRLNKYSEPQPDVTLLKPRADFYARRHPTPADVLLVVEVSETSGTYDRDVKLGLYARAEIPEVWLINIPEDRIENYWQPVNGAYQERQHVHRGQSLAPQRYPHLTLSVDDILG